MTSGVDPSGYSPTVLGHEGAGVVEAVGLGVKRMKVPATEIARIDPMLVLPYRADLKVPPTNPAPAVAPE